MLYCTEPKSCEWAKISGTAPGPVVVVYGPGWCPDGFEWDLAPPGCVRNTYIPPPPKSIALINPFSVQPTSGAYLAEVEPEIPGVDVFGVVRPGNGQRSQIPLRARVTCGAGQSVPGVQVQLTVDVVDRSGGHDHVDGRHVWPHRGSVLVQNAYTDADGYVDFTFRAPVASGDHTIKAGCLNMICGQDERKVWVGMKDLASLYDAHLYRVVGSIHPHMDNHYLTVKAMGNLVWLAELYKARFPLDPVLHLNDASLERGGIFDLRANWQPSHHSHRQGLAIDMVANPAVNPSMAIPSGNFDIFERMACRTGWWANLELPGTTIQHYHAEYELSCFAANPESVAVADATPPTTECGPNPDPQTMPWCF